MAAEEEPTVVSEPTEKTKKAVLRGYRQKLSAIHARIKYHQKTLKTFQKHLKNGTFPQSMKGIKPYPKMNSSEAQALANAACDQVQCLIFDEKMLEEVRKLTQEQNSHQILKEQRQGERQQLKKPKKPKKPTIAKLQQELADLQSKYAQLCSKIESTRE